MTRTRRLSKKKRRTADLKMIRVMAAVFFALIIYLVGYAHGQSSSYDKQNDEVNVQTLGK